MKKPSKLFFLFLLVASTFTKVSAQEINNYTHKLDSVCYGDEAKDLFSYDDRWNCTEIKTIVTSVVPNVVFSDQNFFYDEENRVVKNDYWSEMYRSIHEYSYNENGMVSEDFVTEYYYPDYEESRRYTYDYEYNEQHLLIKTKIYSWNGPVENIYYTYNETGLCVEEIKTGYAGNHELETEKTVYDYYESGLCASITVYTKNDNWDDDWIESSKVEYLYDEIGNCIEYKDYELYNFNYDLTVSIKETAGLMDCLSNVLNFGFVPKNIIANYYKTNPYEGTTLGPITFHYSSCTGVDEIEDGSVKTWPNPVSDLLYLDREGFAEIYSMDGRLITATESTGTINVSSLSPGCYLLRIKTSDGNKIVKRFVKEY